MLCWRLHKNPLILHHGSGWKCQIFAPDTTSSGKGLRNHSMGKLIKVLWTREESRNLVETPKYYCIYLMKNSKYKENTAVHSFLLLSYVTVLCCSGLLCEGERRVEHLLYETGRH
jgi:hypothetical protein